MKKRLLSAFLCAAMLATMIPAAFASDLDGHWSKNFIEYLDDEGIINPSATTGKYEPEWLEKVEPSDFWLEGYEHHAPLTAPMAV